MMGYGYVDPMIGYQTPFVGAPVIGPPVYGPPVMAAPMYGPPVYGPPMMPAYNPYVSSYPMMWDEEVELEPMMYDEGIDGGAVIAPMRRINSNVQSGIQQIGTGNMNLQGNIQQVNRRSMQSEQPKRFSRALSDGMNDDRY
jgi:hypothetical protein